ncbi:MAG TPA: DUF1206 domain-containing protein [Propionicimonas sp.]|uniref:DUF1206 domain-containing protein n=1 Tax=Propionicimonas sp. TaxID=1955623 RepID=UPI002F3F6E31
MGNSAGLKGRLSRAASDVTDNQVVDTGARIGYAVNGVLHLLIAWLGLQVAFGRKGANADPSGAMALVAASPMGLFLLVAIVVAFVLLAVWQVGECVRGPETGDRVKAAAKAVAYLVLASGAVSILLGSGKSGQSQAKDATATLMDLPLGPVLVVVAGLAVAGIGGFHIYKGWTERFRNDLASTPSHAIVIAGKVGYIAKGVALIAVGLGLLVAGLTHQASRSQGLDGALHQMVSLPWGQVLVALVAAGFACFGVYSFSRARRART